VFVIVAPGGIQPVLLGGGKLVLVSHFLQDAHLERCLAVPGEGALQVHVRVLAAAQQVEVIVRPLLEILRASYICLPVQGVDDRIHAHPFAEAPAQPAHAVALHIQNVCFILQYEIVYVKCVKWPTVHLDKHSISVIELV
jgi:hypothetical protein